MTRPGALPRMLLAALLAIAFATGLSACGDDAGSGAGVVVEEADARPARLLGHVVTLSAEVDEALGSRAFSLESPVADDRPVAEGLLVVLTPEAGEVAVDEDARVRVTGEVRLPFRIAEVERELGVELEDDAVHAADLAFHRGQEYIAATEVRVLTGSG